MPYNRLLIDKFPPAPLTSGGVTYPNPQPTPTLPNIQNTNIIINTNTQNSYKSEELLKTQRYS